MYSVPSTTSTYMCLLFGLEIEDFLDGLLLFDYMYVCMLLWRWFMSRWTFFFGCFGLLSLGFCVCVCVFFFFFFEIPPPLFLLFLLVSVFAVVLYVLYLYNYYCSISDIDIDSTVLF